MLERLKRKNGRRDFACLAIPDQFNFALIFEEKEAVLFRNRLPRFNQLYEIALLRVGEFVRFFFRTSHKVRKFRQQLEGPARSTWVPAKNSLPARDAVARVSQFQLSQPFLLELKFRVSQRLADRAVAPSVA